MAKELLTPFGSPASVIELSNGRFRKQILAFRTINYRDRATGQTRRINFDKGYGLELIRSFQQGAYDQVPFQLADASNAHNNDPTRTGGELIGVELSSDGSGLDGIFRLWGSGQKVVDLNKKLGVSARIIEGLEHPDGRKFGKAIQHVLGTVDPQMANMKPWERVDLSNSVTQTLDLSGEHYEEMEGKMPNETGKAVLELSAATAEKLAPLLENPDALTRLAQLLGDDEDPAGSGTEDSSYDDVLSDEDIQALLEGDDDDDEDPDYEGDVELSNVNAQLSSQGQQIVELTNRLNDQRTDHELGEFARKGLAPAILGLARPLLSVAPGAIELSNGSGGAFDPGKAARDLLNAVVDLSSSGHLMVNPDDEAGRLEGDPSQNSQRAALLAEWENYG